MIKEEYNGLRSEILQLQESQQKIRVTAIMSTGACLGWGFAGSESSSPYIFLIPLVFLLPMMYEMTFKTEAMIRIGTYIQIFHESLNDLSGWESNLTSLYKNTSSFSSWHSKFNRSLYCGSTFLLAVISLLSFSLTVNSMTWNLCLLILLLFILALMPFIKLISINKKRQTYIDYWIEIQKKGHEKFAYEK